MPTLLTWPYKGPDGTLHEVQRCYPGERIFSLMNDIKTAERSLMGTHTLRNLMLWHRMARKRMGRSKRPICLVVMCL